MNTLMGLNKFLGEYDNIAKSLAGIIVFVGLYLTYRRTLSLEKRTETDMSRMTGEHFTKAIDQLGHPEVSVRLGGIYALERIAKNNEEYHWPIMETLTAYVRNNTAIPLKDSEEYPAMSGPHYQSGIDIQAIITVLGRRNVAYESANQHLNLNYCCLAGVDMTNSGIGNFSNASFRHSALWWANMRGVNFTGADFSLAQLFHADLSGANLQGVNFLKASLDSANLDGSNCAGTSFHMTSCEFVDFNDVKGDRETSLPERVKLTNELLFERDIE